MPMWLATRPASFEEHACRRAAGAPVRSCQHTPGRLSFVQIVCGIVVTDWNFRPEMTSPASTSSAMWNIVTPNERSPLITCHAIGAKPRYFGSSASCRTTNAEKSSYTSRRTIVRQFSATAMAGRHWSYKDLTVSGATAFAVKNGRPASDASFSSRGTHCTSCASSFMRMQPAKLVPFRIKRSIQVPPAPSAYEHHPVCHCIQYVCAAQVNCSAGIAVSDRYSCQYASSMRSSVSIPNQVRRASEPSCLRSARHLRYSRFIASRNSPTQSGLTSSSALCF